MLRGDYAIRWSILLAVFLASLAACRVIGSPLDLASAWPDARLLLVLFALAALCARLRRVMRRLQHPLDLTQDCCLSVAQVWVLGMAFVLLIYLSAWFGAAVPLRDDMLQYYDAHLGFDWDAVAAWTARHPFIEQLLRQAYVSATPEGAVLLLAGSLLFPGQRSGELIWAAMLACALTAAIFLFAPAIGRIGHLNTAYIGRLMQIRAHAATMSWQQTPSIVCFPSFHMTVAVLFTYVARHRRWLLLACATLNAVMVVALVPIGGHYLVDVLAGAAVALVAIAVTRWASLACRPPIPLFPQPCSQFSRPQWTSSLSTPPICTSMTKPPAPSMLAEPPASPPCSPPPAPTTPISCCWPATPSTTTVSPPQSSNAPAG